MSDSIYKNLNDEFSTKENVKTLWIDFIKWGFAHIN